MARSKSRMHSVTLGGSPDEVEAVFYEALRAGSVDRLMSVWADEDEIVCIHPGGQRLRGVGAIRSAFEAMFADGGHLDVKIASIHRVDALASAVHHVLETIDVVTPQGVVQAYVLATNVYHKTAQGWRLVVHHASPGTSGEAQDISETPTLFH